MSLSCHYLQTSHGSGVALQRQERGGGVLSDVVSEEAKGAFWMRQKRQDMRGGELFFLVLVIKGFLGDCLEETLVS